MFWLLVFAFGVDCCISVFVLSAFGWVWITSLCGLVGFGYGWVGSTLDLCLIAGFVILLSWLEFSFGFWILFDCAF